LFVPEATHSCDDFFANRMTTGSGDTANPTGNAGLGQEVFGPYLVYERLGVGGMATVHRAREHGIEGFERIVALKRLLPHLAEDASFVKSFVREAKLASMLRHANIVQMYELGRVGTTYFISMELIDGRDVRRILRQARKVTGPPTINVTLSLLIQLCDALDYAHTRHDDDTGTPLHIVHRDVSPSNLLITKSGHLKVIDFGIAKAQSSQLRTATGRVKGKLAYMAPEAIAGKELDARSDMFSAGVIAHELLTARPLFASKNEYQTLLKVQKGDILPPSTFNQACPPELDAVVLKALSRDHDQRWRSASEMRDALHEVRIRYHISATNREVAGWCDWAFSMEAPGNNFSGPMVTDSLAGVSQSRSPLPLPPDGDSVQQARTPTSQRGLAVPLPPPTERMSARSASEAEDDVADVAWGGAQEHDSGQPVVLDDVPDHAGRAPSIGPGAVAAAVAADGGTPEWQKLGMDQPPQRTSQRAIAPAKFPQGSSDNALPGRPRTGQFATSEPAPDETARTPMLEASSFGAGMLENKKADNKTTLMIVGGLAVAAIIAIVVVVGFGGNKSGTSAKDQAKAGQTTGSGAVPAAPATGKLKFFVEPKEALVKIAGIEPHNGDGWAVDMDPGTFQVEISATGFKTYITQIELEPAETQSIRVVLEKGGNPAVATLVVDSNPQGLHVFVDGTEVGKTPWTQELPPGSHGIALKDDSGDTKWTKDVTAQANTKYAYSPDVSAERQKQREAAAAAVAAAGSQGPRVAVAAEKRSATKTDDSAHQNIDLGTQVDHHVDTPPPPPTNTGTGSASGSSTETKVEKPVIPETGSGSATKTNTTTGSGTGTGTGTGTGSSKTTTTTTTKPADVKPVMLKPGQVTRTSGDIGNVTADSKEKPEMIAAKVCIDTSGHVTSVKVLKITGDLAAKVQNKLMTFKYTPYKEGGVAKPACLFETFKFKYKDDGRTL
jgi:serine/threonine protein kinase